MARGLEHPAIAQDVFCSKSARQVRETQPAFSSVQWKNQKAAYIHVGIRQIRHLDDIRRGILVFSLFILLSRQCKVSAALYATPWIPPRPWTKPFAQLPLSTCPS